jgi:hypothetical protein
MKISKNVKIQVYCPEKDAQKVRLAIGKAGGGKLGNYHYCSFITKGQGYFLPTEKANPTIGKPGEIAQVNEIKIEFICKKSNIKKVIKAIKKAHSYEEVAIDILPLLNYK